MLIQVKGKRWNAEVRHTDIADETLDPNATGMHVYVVVIGETAVAALEGAFYVFRMFTVGRKHYVREEPMTHDHAFMLGTHVRYRGFVRFTYWLEQGELIPKEPAATIPFGAV